MNRRWLPLVIGAGIVTWVVALAMLAVTTRDSEEFGRLQPWILMVNAAGVLVLLSLLIGRFAEWGGPAIGGCQGGEDRQQEEQREQRAHPRKRAR